MLIAGSSMFEREDGRDLQSLLLRLASLGKFINQKGKWNGFNILHRVSIRTIFTPYLPFLLGPWKCWSLRDRCKPL